MVAVIQNVIAIHIGSTLLVTMYAYYWYYTVSIFWFFLDIYILSILLLFLFQQYFCHLCIIDINNIIINYNRSKSLVFTWLIFLFFIYYTYGEYYCYPYMINIFVFFIYIWLVNISDIHI